MSMNLHTANFEDILAAYYNGTQAEAAARHLIPLIRDKNRLKLSGLLRNHRTKSVFSPQQIKLRAGFDQLLICCSAMEIASLAGFILDVQHTEFGATILEILDDKLIRRYYESYYPTKLPQLFCCRLAGIHTFVGPEANGSAANVLAFLDLDRRFMEQLEDGYFLRLLDAFTIDGYAFRDLVALVHKPDQFISRLLASKKEDNPLSKALKEFSLFMQFCFDLRQLLSATPSPILRSAIWNHYGYWFDIIGDKLKDQLGTALLQFLDWTSTVDDWNAGKAVQGYVAEAH